MRKPSTSLLLAWCCADLCLGCGSNSGGASDGSSGSGGTSAAAGATSSAAGSTSNAGSATGGATATAGSGTGGRSSGAGGALGGSGSTGASGSTGQSGASGSSTGGSSSAGSSSGGSAGTNGAAGAGGAATTTEKFSFFVTSLAAMRMLSGSDKGFGGDLRYGEADGLAGADKICRTIAEMAMPGAGGKGWHAFLSTTAGPVHAIDRIGAGPWYDRLGRLVAMSKADLLHDRPQGAHSAIKDDLPNENGEPNHTAGKPGCTNDCPDNHDILTGTGADGKLHSTNVWSTCHDWTNKENVAPSGDAGPGGAKGPWCGHSWPRQGSGVNWMSSLAEGGCAPGVNLADNSIPGQGGDYTVGGGGGYGGLYCFAMTP